MAISVRTRSCFRRTRLSPSSMVAVSLPTQTVSTGRSSSGSPSSVCLSPTSTLPSSARPGTSSRSRTRTSSCLVSYPSTPPRRRLTDLALQLVKLSSTEPTSVTVLTSASSPISSFLAVVVLRLSTSRTLLLLWILTASLTSSTSSRERTCSSRNRHVCSLRSVRLSCSRTRVPTRVSSSVILVEGAED